MIFEWSSVGRLAELYIYISVGVLAELLFAQPVRYRSVCSVGGSVGSLGAERSPAFMKLFCSRPFCSSSSAFSSLKTLTPTKTETSSKHLSTLDANANAERKRKRV